MKPNSLISCETDFAVRRGHFGDGLGSPSYGRGCETIKKSANEGRVIVTRIVLIWCCWLAIGWLAIGGVTKAVAADWPTHRGTLARTGNVDGGPGPARAEVAWVQRGVEHFLASPATDGQAVFVSGLGAFNSATFQALNPQTAVPNRQRWVKGPPYLKLPLASSPAIAGGLVVFGDGMHQTDGGVLHALRADTGLPVWQYPVPGTLIHLEGGPAVVDGKVFIGGGNAGVLCVDANKLELNGQPTDRATVEAEIKKRWQEMLAKYEQEKKVDPDFAVPPSEDSLPKPRPRKVWQAGAGQWHVDAPLAVAGDRVFAASAFLEAERVGERVLLALNSADGTVIWKTPFSLNPWAGPTVAGEMVLVGGSNIRLEPRDVPQGRGEVMAVDRATGAVKWKRDVAGGVVSSIAVAGPLAIFTATDGKVRAWDIMTGADRWTFDGGGPYFAAPAIAGGSVYVASLSGQVHALQLANGQSQWQLDLATHPDVRAPGQVYGSPIIAGGKLFVATCNLAADGGPRTTVVVAIGAK
jgi:outer membrane protein assembly factor BamB